MKVHALFLLIYYFNGVQAGLEDQIIELDQLTFTGCANYILDTVPYTTQFMDWAVFCRDMNALSSLVGCFESIGRNELYMYGYLFEECASENLVLDESNITNAANHLLIDGVPAEFIHKDTPSENVKRPVIVNGTVAMLFVLGQQQYDKMYSDSTWYGIGALGYWLSVCLVGAIANWSVIIFPSLRFKLNGTIAKSWRKYITLPALAKKSQSRLKTIGLIGMLLPSRIETIVSVLFLVLLVVFSAAGINPYKNNPNFALNEFTLTKYVGDRAAHLCIFLVPLLLLFGGRNNFLIWLTRWKFSTFVAYHRWIGRWVVLLAIVHGCSYSSLFSMTNTYGSRVATSFIQWGITGIVAGSLVLFQGLLFLRRRWYEFFLITHIVLVFVFVFSAYQHTEDLGFSGVLYASFAIWGFDRFVRLARLVVFGFPMAEISLQDDKIRVTIPKPVHWTAVPGGHAWIHFGDKAWFWQSHPFCCIADETNLTFYCKVQKGITAKFQRQLQSHPEKSFKIRVGVEGPYGKSNPIKHHSDVVFIAGGNGFPGIFSELEQLLKAPNSKQRLQFNWIVKDVDSFNMMAEHINRLSIARIEFNVYITQKSTPGPKSLDSPCEEDVFAEKESISQGSIPQEEFPSVNFFFGRPDLMETVQSNIEDCSTGVAFVCCGPTAMIDDLRYFVVSNIDKTKKRVDFYDTLEIWA